MITLLLVDDHTYIRQGLQVLLEETPDIEVVGTASNGIEAIAKASTLQPDVVVIDISMPLMDGIEATRQLHECCPRTHVLALSIYDNPEYIRSVLQAGAAGYVLKDAIGQELLEAIRSVHSGKPYFSPKLPGRFHQQTDEDPPSG
jgi:two-component system nitrate/nitrite response regulator NarL